jgi:urease accessory protein
LSNVAGRTAAVRLQASSPLRLLAPSSHGTAAWIFAGTYGGGLVGGDRISLQVEAGNETRCLLGTQASTKVFRTDGPGCRQELTASVGHGSLVVSAPDPIVCFAGSRYDQLQRFDLAEDAAIVSVESITSGRCGRGERWAMDRYQSRTEVWQDDRCLYRDVLRLDPSDGPIGGAMRMGRCDCFASLLIVGNTLRVAIDDVLKFVAAQPASGPLLLGASPIGDGGVRRGAIVRVAGPNTEMVTHWLRERLRFLIEPLGGDPWSRKW